MRLQPPEKATPADELAEREALQQAVIDQWSRIADLLRLNSLLREEARESTASADRTRGERDAVAARLAALTAERDRAWARLEDIEDSLAWRAARWVREGLFPATSRRGRLLRGLLRRWRGDEPRE